MNPIAVRRRNPFGLTVPFEKQDPGTHPAVFGFGDVTADFHVIGDHPGVHGGCRTGIPFTDHSAGAAVRAVLSEVGLASETDDAYDPSNLFASYVHMCCLPDGRTPTTEEYATLERFFDAELRAVNAHILIPVGERPIDHVIETYTNQAHRVDDDVRALHATEVRGRGFLVVPMLDPSRWTTGDRDAIVERLGAVMDRDYRQTKGVATLVG